MESIFCNPHGDCYKIGIVVHPVEGRNPVIGWAVLKRENNSETWTPVDIRMIKRTKPEAMEHLNRIRRRERAIWHF